MSHNQSASIAKTLLFCFKEAVWPAVPTILKYFLVFVSLARRANCGMALLVLIDASEVVCGIQQVKLAAVLAGLTGMD